MRVKSSRSFLPIGVLVGAWSCAAPATSSKLAPPPEAVAPVVASAPPTAVTSADPKTSASVVADLSSSVVASASASASPVPVPSGITIAPGARIFLFGDSMVIAGLGQRFEKLATNRGAKYAENHWSSSTTKTWSESERLPNLLFKNKPDVVFIAIGSNEVYFLDKHADEHIKAIVKKLGGKPCVWIGPPVWKKQTGIVEAERDNAAPCAFFDSSTLQLDRQPDGIHPSLKGGAQWAEAVWTATVAP